MNGKRILISCAATVLVAVFLPTAQAQQGGKIRFGNLAVIPGIAVEGLYDDNIFLGNGKTYAGDAAKTLAEKKESDWITHVKPGLSLNYTLPERGSVRLGYQGDYAFYDKNRSNNWKNNQGNLAVDYRAPGGLILGITELYSRSEDPYGSADQYGTGRVTKRWTNDAQTKLGYNLMANLRSFLYYNNYKQQYADALDATQDYTNNEYGLGLETRFLPKTWGFVRYLYGQKRYNSTPAGQTDEFNSDSNWHRASAGLTWDPGAKLSGEVNVGYQWHKYDHEFTSAARTVRRNDENNWIAQTAVTFLPTTTTALSLSVTRTTRDTASDTNERFVDTGIGLNLQQDFYTKFTLKAGLTYSKNEYNIPVGNPRVDDNYTANIGLDYRIRDWLGFGVEYRLNRKDSNTDTNDFVDNKFTASLKAVY